MSQHHPVARTALGALAVGAVAGGALALGAVAMGAFAVGRLAIGRGTIRSLHIDDLSVDRLRVREQQSAPPGARAIEAERGVLLQETAAVLGHEREPATPGAPLARRRDHG